VLLLEAGASTTCRNVDGQLAVDRAREGEHQNVLGLCGKHGRYGRPARTHLPISRIGRGWLRLEAALSLIWRWRGVLEGDLVKASGRLFPTQVLDLLTAHAHSLVGAPQAACPCPPFEVCACAPLPGDAVSGARQIQID
jgi:hypothetical protein